MPDAGLSFTGKRWRVPEIRFESSSHALAHLQNTRGIDVRRAPALYAPDVFFDMALAKDRIKEALRRRERIGIFGDYDCDGITAVAQILRACRRHGSDPWVRLPHRVRDGYGLHPRIVREIADAKINLLITADTGITAVKEIAALREHGIDVIVTDHHQVREEIPQATAIVHPHVSACPAPHPSGSGVAFHLIAAIEDGSWEGMEEDLALAMFGTVADLVPLRGGNRALVELGLRALHGLRHGPIAELRDSVRTGDSPLRSSDIAFRIAPRINAAGRMEDPLLALTALLEGGDAIQKIIALNIKRQELLQGFVADAIAMMSSEGEKNFLCICKPKLPHGLLGLVAGKLAERFGRPSLVGTVDGDTCTASLRSPECYHITDGLARAGHLLESFGGHAQAAGAVFPLCNLAALRDHFEKDIAGHTGGDDLLPNIALEGILDPACITPKFPAAISALEPFGQGNPEPRFLIRDVTIRDIQQIGTDGHHLRGRIGGIKTIGFGLGSYAPRLETPVDAAARVELDAWNGRVLPQIVIEDLRAGNDQNNNEPR